MEASFTQQDVVPPDALTISDLEDQIDSLLRSHGQNDLWSWPLPWRGGTSSRRCWNRCSRILMRTPPEPLWSGSPPRWRSQVCYTKLRAAPRGFRTWSARSRNTPTWTRRAVQNVDIVKSLETTLTILNHKLKQGVAVQRDYQRVPLLVNSFGSELNQVWTNIIDNAIDAMHGKGELRVRTYREDGCVVVEIGDNGPGISREVQPHIFEPFFTTKGVGEGTGLGLDTVQRIVKKHRGNIQVTSKPGDTRFQVWLPLAGSS